MRRCYNRNAINYARYGGRGIRVCRRWHNVVRFIADMGRRPSAVHSIERKRNSRGYSPTNCCWATPREQSENTRRNRRVRIGHSVKTTIEWGALVGLSSKRINRRLDGGWTAYEAVLLPATQRKRRPMRDAATIARARVLLHAKKFRALRTRKVCTWQELQRLHQRVGEKGRLTFKPPAAGLSGEADPLRASTSTPEASPSSRASAPNPRLRS